MAELPNHLVDKRTWERNMRRGLLDKKDYEKHLKDLPDSAEKAEVVPLGEPAGSAQSDE